jgi:hypothetical protein
MEIKPHQIYQSMMLEIKIRIRAIDNAFKEGKGKLSPLMVEFCFLQSRKIIEQVCFSAILCDKQRYEDFRKLEGLTSDNDHGNYIKDWNARVILKKLNDITPYFLPRPLGKMVSKQDHYHFEEGFKTTHSELIEMWKNCGSFLHIPRPFGETYESHIAKQKVKYKAAITTLKEYSEYFKKLLWYHAAIGIEYSQNEDILNATEPGGPERAWLVHFGEYESDTISITLAEGKNS